MSDSSDTKSFELRDFPDWLGPALVKDLRRGLKLRGFTATFLCLIIAITFLLVGAILTDGSESVMGVVWIPVAITLLVAQPLRGMTAIVEERKLETLPLIQLTRLNALKIVSGKWSALAFQTVLLTVALLPYMVLGHFLGGFEFTQNVLTLLVLTVFSLVLTAVMVALSVVTLALVRSLMAAAVLGPILISLLTGGVAMMFSGDFSTFEPSALLIVLGVSAAVGAFLIYYLLSAAASQIALPGTENHSTRRRLVALIVVALIGGVGALMSHSSALTGVIDVEPLFIIPLYFIAGVVVTDCLVDPAGTSVRTARQFLGKRVFSYWFAPGWPSGWLFALTVAVLSWLATALIIGYDAHFDDEEWGFVLAGTSALFAPGAIALLMPKGRQAPLNSYLLAHLILLAVSALVAILAGMSSTSGFLALTPWTNMALADGSSSDTALSIVASFVHVGFATTIWIIKSSPFRKKFSEQFAEAAASARK